MTMTNNKNNNHDKRWSDEHFEGMARLWELSAKDRQKMQEFQNRISDIDHWKNDPYEVVRFYDETGGHLTKAEKLFRAMIQWRLENGIDNFLQRYRVDPGFLQWPIAILDTTCKQGDPIYVERFGATDFSGFLKQFGPEAATDYSCTFLRETYSTPSFWQDHEAKIGRRVRQFTLIVDLHGGGLDCVRPTILAHLQRMIKISQEYYPGWAKRVICLGSPSCFSYVWPVIKPFFDKNLRDRFIFTTQSNYRTVLEKYVELKDLPSFICPEGKAKGKPGFFENVSLEGGPFKMKPGQEGALQLSHTGFATSKKAPSSDSDLDDSSSRTNVRVEKLLKGVAGRSTIIASAC